MVHCESLEGACDVLRFHIYCCLFLSKTESSRMSLGYLSYMAINRRNKRLQLALVSEMLAWAFALAIKTRAVRRTEKKTLRAHANYTPRTVVLRAKKRDSAWRCHQRWWWRSCSFHALRATRLKLPLDYPRGRAKHRASDGAIGRAVPETSRLENKCTLMECEALPDDKTVRMSFAC